LPAGIDALRTPNVKLYEVLDSSPVFPGHVIKPVLDIVTLLGKFPREINAHSVGAPL
jgi:hypothetical protein